MSNYTRKIIVTATLFKIQGHGNLMNIVITTNLKGNLKGAQKHTSYQTYSVEVGNGKNRLVITKDILHTDREEQIVTRKTNISSEVVDNWLFNCPSWERPKHWKLMSANQKIKSYIKSFDEGFGVSFEITSK